MEVVIFWEIKKEEEESHDLRHNIGLLLLVKLFGLHTYIRHNKITH